MTYNKENDSLSIDEEKVTNQIWYRIKNARKKKGLMTLCLLLEL